MTKIKNIDMQCSIMSGTFWSIWVKAPRRTYDKVMTAFLRSRPTSSIERERHFLTHLKHNMSNTLWKK